MYKVLIPVLRLVLLFSLVLTITASLQANNATVEIICDESAMTIQMNFTHPFGGIIFTPDNFFNPNCSYAASPISTLKKFNISIPYGTCGMEVQFEWNTTLASNNLIVMQNRMMDTEFDFVQSVSCEIPTSVDPNAVRDPDVLPYPKPPRFESWIAVELGAQVYPEDIAEIMGIDDQLMLTYHIRDGGVHKDMVVLNCVAHDDMFLGQNTNVYQMSNTFGCAEESDLVSNFTVLRRSGGDTNLLAYATIKNISMVVKGKFYITCAAQLCEDTCQRNCSGQPDLLYFTDLATKGMVNRNPSSVTPLTLSMLDGFGRLRRSHDKEVIDLLLKLNFKDSYLPDSTDFSVNLPEGKLTFNSSSLKTVRSERSLDFKEPRSNTGIQRLSFIQSDRTDPLRSYFVALSANDTLLNRLRFDRLKSGSAVYADERNRLVNPKFLFKDFDHDVQKSLQKPDYIIFASHFQTIVAVVVLLCISSVCYLVLFVKRRPQALVVSDYLS